MGPDLIRQPGDADEMDLDLSPVADPDPADGVELDGTHHEEQGLEHPQREEAGAVETDGPGEAPRLPPVFRADRVDQERAGNLIRVYSRQGDSFPQARLHAIEQAPDVLLMLPADEQRRRRAEKDVRGGGADHREGDGQ